MGALAALRLLPAGEEVLAQAEDAVAQAAGSREDAVEGLGNERDEAGARLLADAVVGGGLDEGGEDVALQVALEQLGGDAVVEREGALECHVALVGVGVEAEGLLGLALRPVLLLVSEAVCLHDRAAQRERPDVVGGRLGLRGFGLQLDSQLLDLAEREDHLLDVTLLEHKMFSLSFVVGTESSSGIVLCTQSVNTR